MSGYRFERIRILLVDDDAHMRRLVIAILKAFGIQELGEAPDAESAWRMLRENTPDIVILDWAMEGMSGIDFTRRIRTHPQCPNPFLPVIMLTAQTQLDRVQQARDCGINEFLAKPVSAKALLSRLVSVIEQPRPFVRTTRYFGPCRRRRTGQQYQGPERRDETAAAAAE